MDIQPSDCEPAEQMRAPSPMGDGGNSTLTNQDEDDVPAATYENVTVMAAPQSDGFHPGSWRG